ncbi:serine hydrolase [Candidatus Pantoea carbekii]|uniref:serine-type D-Ala-D-Ala carboxypeptidase n=1 Tax=Candidatus Pantoea carbekii TaxID=1235990 RepID=U3U6X8_9GAMM|nr:serine hydrolase [Candidatus Pantoea carbekii]AKC32211.1 penicillin-binding protein 5 precursor DacA [Candidatus Pantoea carbekii]BAO00745.1 DacA protein [Candidatus Pantoea carbekii]
MNILKAFLFFKYLTIILITISFSCMTCADVVNFNAMTILPYKPSIHAPAYVLIDYNSGAILAEHNSDVRRNPASLTKMMTSYIVGLAVKAGKIHQNDIVTIGKDAWATGNPIFKGSSLMFLKPGDQVLISQLRRGIVLQSGNDACVAIADYIAGDQNAFVKLMNNYASILGLKNTRFQTVHGLDTQDQYSSAHDMALIGQALIRDVPDEYAIYNEKVFTFNHIRQINRNGLLWDNSIHADGIKTGHTNAAGFNLVASAKNKNMRLISSVLGANTYKIRETETKKLLTWGFRSFETVIALKSEKEFTSETVWFGKDNHVSLGVQKDTYITIPRGRINDLKAQYILNSTKPLFAPLKKYQVIGNIKFQLDGKIIQERPLVILNTVQKSWFINRIIDYIHLTCRNLFF